MILVLCLLAPTAAWAGEDEDEPFASFAVKASNGYRIVVFAEAEAEDEPGPRGNILLLVLNRDQQRIAYYHTKAIVTETVLQADFGRLGHVNLVLAKSTKKRRVPLRCLGRRIPVEKGTYWGSFEFHGEQGFTEASASRIAYNPYAFIGLFLCNNPVEVDASGPTNRGPGALLRGFGKSKRSSFAVVAVKNRPKGRVLLRASMREQRGGVGIVRGVEIKAGAGVFDYDRGLRAATLDPPAPFSGSASFRRDAEGAGRWSGNLRVDLPGRANVSLTRPELRPKLRRGSWSVSESLFERPFLGRPLGLLEAP